MGVAAENNIKSYFILYPPIFHLIKFDKSQALKCSLMLIVPWVVMNYFSRDYHTLSPFSSHQEAYDNNIHKTVGQTNINT